MVRTPKESSGEEGEQVVEVEGEVEEERRRRAEEEAEEQAEEQAEEEAEQAEGGGGGGGERRRRWDEYWNSCVRIEELSRFFSEACGPAARACKYADIALYYFLKHSVPTPALRATRVGLPRALDALLRQAARRDGWLARADPRGGVGGGDGGGWGRGAV